MIDTELEEFTAAEAINAGLVDAIKDGSTKISGTYELEQDGCTGFNQNNFTFRDKCNKLRVGYFATPQELFMFLEEYGKITTPENGESVGIELGE